MEIDLIDNSKKTIKADVIRLDEAIKIIRQYMQKKEKNVDLLKKAVGLLYDTLEQDFRDNYVIRKMAMKRKRIKSRTDFSNFDSVESEKPIAIKNSEENSSFAEFNLLSSSGKNMSFDRGTAMKMFDEPSRETVGDFERILREMQKKLINLLGQNPVVPNSGVTNSSGTDVTPKIKKLTHQFKEVLDLSEVEGSEAFNFTMLEDPASYMDSVSVSIDGNMSKEQMDKNVLENLLLKDGVDLSFAGSIVPFEPSMEIKEKDSLEVLDVEDWKMIKTDKEAKNLVEEPGAQKLVSSFVNMEEPREEGLELEYLEYGVDVDGEELLADPVWKPASSAPKGKEHLFRVKSKKPIQGQFFIKRV